MRLNVFGRDVEVIRKSNKWRVFYLGSEGKKRLAGDIHVPDDIAASEVVEYISDLCHEWATAKYPQVQVLSPR